MSATRSPRSGLSHTCRQYSDASVPRLPSGVFPADESAVIPGKPFKTAFPFCGVRHIFLNNDIVHMLVVCEPLLTRHGPISELLAGLAQTRRLVELEFIDTYQDVLRRILCICLSNPPCRMEFSDRINFFPANCQSLSSCPCPKRFFCL